MVSDKNENAVTYLDEEEARIIYFQLIDGIEEYELSNGEKGGMGPYGVHVARRAARKMCPVDYEDRIKEINELKKKLKR